MIKNRTYNNEQGNAFLLVMLGVALFAALGFTISRSMRSDSTKRLSDREIQLTVTEILDFGQKMSRAVDRVRRKGCSENQISFEDPQGNSMRASGTAFTYTNANSPADGSCNIFSSNGGNMSSHLPVSEKVSISPSAVSPSYMHPQSFFISATRVAGNGTDTGASGTDLILWVGRLTSQTCMAINDKLGIDNPGGAPPVDAWDCNGSPFTGSFTDCLNPIGNSVTQLAGKDAFCVAGVGDENNYHFIQVLLSR